MKKSRKTAGHWIDVIKQSFQSFGIVYLIFSIVYMIFFIVHRRAAIACLLQASYVDCVKFLLYQDQIANPIGNLLYFS